MRAWPLYRVLACAGVLMAIVAGPARAQTQTSVGVPGKGHGAVAVSLQQVEANRRAVPAALGGGLTELGDVTLRSAVLELDYGISDRIAFNATLPFKSNRYVGNTPHDPRRLQDDHGETFLDDGNYHSGLGDFGVGLRWLWLTEPVAVTPFLSFYYPTHDYPIFTGTAFGSQQWRLDLGVNLGARVPGPIRNLYWQFGYAYSYMEKTRPDNSPDHRVNHSVASFELGYLATPRLSTTIAWRYRRAHDGLEMPADFNFPFTDDLYYYHDQLFALEQSTVNMGLTYQLNERYSLHASYGRTLHVVLGTQIRRALSIGLSRSF